MDLLSQITHKIKKSINVITTYANFRLRKRSYRKINFHEIALTTVCVLKHRLLDTIITNV